MNLESNQFDSEENSTIEKNRKLTVFVALIVLALISCGIFTYKMKVMNQSIMYDHSQINEIDLSGVEDGIYKAGNKYFVAGVNLSVSVKEGRIEKIIVNNQDCGKGYEALETIDRIIEDQKFKVDAVTGATASSRIIMLAVEKALRKATRFRAD